jgi:abortive infection bacteriophage resistance protein
MKFDKPPKTFAEQVDLLRVRGLIIDDQATAEHYLSHLNYYRFAGYLLPFESDHATHEIVPGARFDDIINLYAFDRELRLLLLDAIERIEVSVRTQWSYHVAHESKAHGYLQIAHAASARRFARQLGLLEGELSRSSETFIKHFREKYSDPDLPPIWAACEVMSLGQLSNWYGMLRPIALRKRISKTYLLDQQVLESALHHLSYVRNICAHHSRLWNREMVITFSVPKRPAGLRDAIADPDGRKLYNSLCLIVHLIDCISPGHHWRDRLQDIVGRYGPDLSAMGFPGDWRERQLWSR